MARRALGATVQACVARRRAGMAACWVAGLSLLMWAGCGEESPTEVGGALLPDDAVRTFEVVLDPARYLMIDTVFTGFDRLRDADFFVVANQFEGVLDAHTVARFDVPSTIGAADSTGLVRTDTIPTIVGGRIVIQLDTIRSEVERPLVLRLFRIEEEWDPATATWELRVDSAGRSLPWSQAGGLGGTYVDSAVWSDASVDSLGVLVDSMVIPVDSQTMALWSDTTTQARGGVITMASTGGRLRSSDVVLRVDARPSFKPDTVVTVTVRPGVPRFIHDPALEPEGATLITGGLPEWRTFLRFRDGLDTLQVSCAQIAPGCTARLAEADITYAALLMVPAEAPPGFVPQDSLRVISAPLLVSALTPLERSPLGRSVGFGRTFLSPSTFRPPLSGSPTEIPVTDFLRPLVADTAVAGAAPTSWLALLPLVSAFDFGVAAFEPGPRLRLILTVARELQLR